EQWTHRSLLHHATSQHELQGGASSQHAWVVIPHGRGRWGPPPPLTCFSSSTNNGRMEPSFSMTGSERVPELYGGAHRRVKDEVGAPVPRPTWHKPLRAIAEWHEFRSPRSGRRRAPR